VSRKRNLLNDLHDLARIEPDAEASQRAVHRAQIALRASAAQSAATTPRLLFGGKLMRPRNLAAMAAGALVIVLGVQLLPMRSGANFAFAQVQQEVARTKSVQFVQTIKYPGQKDQFHGVDHVWILGAHLCRSETTWDRPVLSTLSNGNQLSISKVVVIDDAGAPKSLVLYPEIKDYYAYSYSVDATGGGFSFSAMPIQMRQELGLEVRDDVRADFYESFRRIPGDKAIELPAQPIDGRQAIGFLIEQKAETSKGSATWKVTHWVDPTTKLPIRVETSYRSTFSPEKIYDTDTVISDIKFDAPLDPGLFNTDPPQGWTNLNPK
jgi:hypothetical protein